MYNVNFMESIIFYTMYNVNFMEIIVSVVRSKH